MDGVALIGVPRTLAPHLAIVASTGLGEEAKIAEIKRMGVETILQKPCNTAKLLRTIHP
jgi:CheY-like chemotaxis protein